MLHQNIISIITVATAVKISNMMFVFNLKTLLPQNMAQVETIWEL